jgi:hypothetical protein
VEPLKLAVALRACSQSLYKNSNKRQNDHLLRMARFAPAILAKPARLVYPPKTPFYHPPLGQYREGM